MFGKIAVLSVVFLRELFEHDIDMFVLSVDVFSHRVHENLMFLLARAWEAAASEV